MSIQSEAALEAGTQQNIFFAVTGLFTYHPPVKVSQLRLPCGSKTSQGGKSRTRIIGPVGMVPAVPADFHTHTMRTVAAIKFRDA